MALSAVLLFPQTKKYKVDLVFFDLILNEEHRMTNKVSEHNIEDGQPITDHIENQLLHGGLTGLITNYSIRRPGVLFGNVAQKNFDLLEQIWKERRLVEIVTILRVYKNVAITDISVQRSETTGAAISVSVTFKQVNVVKLKKSLLEVGVSVTDMGVSTNRQAAVNTNVGTVR